ncbi:hypothetical protein ABFS82_07G011400 [Erythranthe guttata]|uniref:Uncharacterized protein n=1 Tax=Erythranthe guttata TaxID=4155 RepID=A0A022RVB2_ERYGU|nr:hypothetical protein MIMGU_mgv1a016899mg [Erythranthe guttata]
MASKEDLIRIGIEGFRLVDEYMEKKGRSAAPKKPSYATKQRPNFPRENINRQTCMYQYQPQRAPLHQVIKPVSSNEIVNSYEAVQFRDGVSVMDYSKRNMLY